VLAGTIAVGAIHYQQALATKTGAASVLRQMPAS